MPQTPSGTKRNPDLSDAGGGKKARAENLTLRFLLQSKHAGGIIGKGGQTIKRLRSEYSATISVPDSSTNERVLSISASQENAINVLKECLPLFHEPPYPYGSTNQEKQNQHEINFLVHSSQVSAIIGRSGGKVKEIQEKTLISIKILPNCLLSSVERVAILVGTEDSIVNALCKILEIIQEVPIKGNIAFYDPNQDGWNESGFNDYSGQSGGGIRGSTMRGATRGSSRGAGRGGGSSFASGGGFSQNSGSYGSTSAGRSEPYGSNPNYGGDSNIGSGESTTSQVTIPNDVAGAIIGKGGERIRNIRQRSGADIKIEDPQPGKQDRVITCCGFADQIQYAEFLMQQSIRQHSHKK